MFSEPSWNCSRVKSCGWSTVTGSMPPDPRRQMRVHRTLFLSAEVLNHASGRHKQMTPSATFNARLLAEFRQAPIRASLCTSSDTVWTRCAVTQEANATDRESSWRHVSIFLHHKASSPRHSSRAADDQEHIKSHQRGGCCNSQSCWLQSCWLRIWLCWTEVA